MAEGYVHPAESLKPVAKAGTSGSPRQEMTQGVGRAAGMVEEPGVGLNRCLHSALLTHYHACFIETKLLEGLALESVHYVGKVAA